MILTDKISDQDATSAEIECPQEGCSRRFINNKRSITSTMLRHLQGSDHKLDGKELLAAMRNFKPDYMPRRKRGSDNDQRYLVQ